MCYESWGRKSRSWTSWCTRRKRFARTRIDSKCTAKVSSFLSVSTLFNSQKIFIFALPPPPFNPYRFDPPPVSFIILSYYHSRLFIVVLDSTLTFDSSCKKNNFFPRVKYKMTYRRNENQKMELNDNEEEVSSSRWIDIIRIDNQHDFNKFLSP